MVEDEELGGERDYLDQHISKKVISCGNTMLLILRNQFPLLVSLLCGQVPRDELF